MARCDVNQELLANDFMNLNAQREAELKAVDEKDFQQEVEDVLSVRLNDIKAQIKEELKTNAVNSIKEKYDTKLEILSKYVTIVEE